MDAILCLQNEPLHFSEKHQRDEIKLHRQYYEREIFLKNRLNAILKPIVGKLSERNAPIYGSSAASLMTMW
jgi:hypothetical protein